MMVLPKGAFTVIQDEAPKTVEKKTTIIMSLEEVDAKPQKPNTGTICYTATELNRYQGCKVVFRENFCEEILINGVDHLYFRDFESSIYYVIEDKK